MNKLQNIERQSQDTWFTAYYTDDQGILCELVFRTTYCYNLGCELTELISAQAEEMELPEDSPLYLEIKDAVRTIDQMLLV